MNDTNLVSLLITLMAQKAVVAPVASNNALLIVTMILSALGPIIAGLAAKYASEAKMKVSESKDEIVTLKEHINSRMDELQKETKRASFAEGADDQRQRALAIGTAPPADVPLSPAVLAQIVAAVSSAQQNKGKDKDSV